VKQGITHWITKIRTSGMGNMSTLNVAYRLVFYPRNIGKGHPATGRGGPRGSE